METGKIRITTGKVDIRTLTDILNGKYDEELNKGDFGVVLISVTDGETASEEIEDAFDDGFDEGYDAGYADGYMKAKKEAAHNGKNA